MTIRSTPCEAWTTIEDLDACCTSSASDELKQLAIDAASEVLFLKSGLKFGGVCESTDRPTSCRRGDPSPRRWGWRESWGRCSCGIGDSCGCDGRKVYVPIGQPVVEVTEVKVDGVVLAAGDYRLDDSRFVRRIDGTPWPCCQDRDLPDTEVGTWSVTYTYGRTPPPGGVLSARLYACQIAKCGGDGCELPDNIQSIVRQGVSAGFVDVEQLAAIGSTGIPFVDDWLDAVNPSKRRRPLAMASPDIPPRAFRPGS